MFTRPRRLFHDQYQDQDGSELQDALDPYDRASSVWARDRPRTTGTQAAKARRPSTAVPVNVMVALPATVKTAAPTPSGLVAPTTVPAAVSPTPVAPSKAKIPGRQPRGPLRKAKKVYWDQLKTGDCFKGWTEKGTTMITRVDCRSPHEEEVTGTFNLPDGRYPGDAAVDKAGDARCKKYFTRYVGIDWDSSAYNYDYATPDSSSWRYGDRLVICVADDPNHPKGNRISLRKVKQ